MAEMKTQEAGGRMENVVAPGSIGWEETGHPADTDANPQGVGPVAVGAPCAEKIRVPRTPSPGYSERRMPPHSSGFDSSRATPLELTALVAGTLTLGLGIVVGRLLAPYFGSSLHPWAALTADAAPDPALLLTDDRNDTESRLHETRQHVFVSRTF